MDNLAFTSNIVNLCFHLSVMFLIMIITPFCWIGLFICLRGRQRIVVAQDEEAIEMEDIDGERNDANNSEPTLGQ